MRDTSKELLNSNSDVLDLIHLVKGIGWESIRLQSIQRIIYLSKVLYSFVYNDTKNPFENYHFSASLSGPYSDLVTNSVIFLKSNEFLHDEDGELKIVSDSIDKHSTGNNYEWLKIIIYILGLYGEDKIFGFTINDPLYKDSIQRNDPKELNASPDNLTILVLNRFKSAFEETLNDTSKIDKKEYLELYFEYIFSKIIKREE